MGRYIRGQGIYFAIALSRKRSCATIAVKYDQKDECPACPERQTPLGFPFQLRETRLDNDCEMDRDPYRGRDGDKDRAD